MGTHFTWYPIVPEVPLETVLQTYCEWPDPEDPRQSYKRDKWFKTVNQPQAIESLEDLLLHYQPGIVVTEENGRKSFALWMPTGDPVDLMLDYTVYVPDDNLYRGVTFKLGSNQQDDRQCLKQSLHFLAYLTKRGHGLASAEDGGWLEPGWLVRTAEKQEKLPVYSRFLKLAAGRAQQAYRQWKEKE
ncbi:hypothetical protein ACTID9_25350 [Brevibacillus fluminis]|uniref:hypothetical protein n=1 Tax=Brevibacillus fluminis TaxID=511487 RepID=UPI003F8C9D6E